MTDLINKPPHYTHGAIEPIDVIESWNLPFHLGNVIKYIARHEHKGAAVADIRKARWYLDRYLTLLEFSPAEDRETARKERLRCFIHDEAYARVEPGLKEIASFDVTATGEVLEVLK